MVSVGQTINQNNRNHRKGYTMTENTAVEVFETTSTVGLMDEIQALKNGKTPVLSTMDGDDRESRIATLQAMTDSIPLDDVMGKELELAHYVVQPVEMPDEKTGELLQVPRIILVTKDGKAYHAISSGIFSALKNISSILGMPSKDNKEWPVKVTPSTDKTRQGYRVFTLKVTG